MQITSNAESKLATSTRYVPVTGAATPSITAASVPDVLARTAPVGAKSNPWPEVVVVGDLADVYADPITSVRGECPGVQVATDDLAGVGGAVGKRSAIVAWRMVIASGVFVIVRRYVPEPSKPLSKLLTRTR